MRKLSDIQLSRVLSCAANGTLGSVGCSPAEENYEQRGQNACLVQAALATWEGYSNYDDLPKRYSAHAKWFDNGIYLTEVVVDPDRLLTLLEEVGIA